MTLFEDPLGALAEKVLPPHDQLELHRHGHLDDLTVIAELKVNEELTPTSAQD